MRKLSADAILPREMNTQAAGYMTRQPLDTIS